MDTVEKIAKAMFEAVEAETRDINPGKLRPISWEERKKEMLQDPRHGDPYTGARAAIEAYQDAIWPIHHFTDRAMLPELRHIKAQQITAHILQVIGPFLCDHGDSRGYQDAGRALQQMFHEAGADIITDADRRVAGLTDRGPSGLTAQELSILENRKLEAMMQPIRPMIIDR